MDERSAASAATARGRSLYVLSQFPPPYGGLSIHSERLRATLEKRGWRVRSLTIPAPPAPELRWRRTRILLGQLGFLARLLLTSGALVHDHVSTYWVGPPRGTETLWSLSRLAVLRLRPGPWVVTCGKGQLPAALAACPGWLRRLYRWLYSGASQGIAKNEPILGSFAELGLAGRARVVGTFLEPVRAPGSRGLPEDVESFLRAHPLSVITAAFQFEPLYHVHDVVRALDFVRRHGPERGLESEIGLLVLASRIERPAGREAFEAALAETALAAHVLVLRDVDHALDVIARASAFVRATDADGDANTVKEAMMLGVPVLATALPGRPPGIELIDREDLAALGPRLLELLVRRDPERLEANREFVHRDIERNTAAILEVYARACGGG